MQLLVDNRHQITEQKKKKAGWMESWINWLPLVASLGPGFESGFLSRLVCRCSSSGFRCYNMWLLLKKTKPYTLPEKTFGWSMLIPVRLLQMLSTGWALCDFHLAWILQGVLFADWPLFSLMWWCPINRKNESTAVGHWAGVDSFKVFKKEIVCQLLIALLDPCPPTNESPHTFG